MLKGTKRNNQRLQLSEMPSVELGKPAQRELFEDLTGAQQVEKNPLLAKLQTIKSRLK